MNSQESLWCGASLSFWLAVVTAAARRENKTRSAFARGETRRMLPDVSNTAKELKPNRSVLDTKRLQKSYQSDHRPASVGRECLLSAIINGDKLPTQGFQGTSKHVMILGRKEGLKVIWPDADCQISAKGGSPWPWMRKKSEPYPAKITSMRS